ncbi:sarcosine oxidase subunit gamma [Halodurantibacterium flavum]|uniref:Sarcosine oxidase subunit gamma n=1 Tax=Halodurantibacterium flavum TaxID=1382802 RepID=A0ABW4S3I0_9RHOB
MAELLPSEPLETLLPETIGGCRLALLPQDRLTLIAPYQGRREEVDLALRSCDLGFPAPNRVIEGPGGRAGERIVWWGREAAMLIGTDAPRDMPAAVTDQTDGWRGFRLEGGAHVDVLARLVPVDLRVGVFAPGQAARTLLGHMSVTVVRRDEAGLEFYVMRSMARTAVHEILSAMARVAAYP